jgi:hypothetical protein
MEFRDEFINNRYPTDVKPPALTKRAVWLLGVVRDLSDRTSPVEPFDAYIGVAVPRSIELASDRAS